MDFQDGSGWSTEYSNEDQLEIYDFANWNLLQSYKGGVICRKSADRLFTFGGDEDVEQECFS